MPRFDGTGPMGAGPMTGRGMGPCGRGFARGRGFRNAWYPVPTQPTKDEEIAELKAEKEAIENEKKAIETRLKELEKN